PSGAPGPRRPGAPPRNPDRPRSLRRRGRLVLGRPAPRPHRLRAAAHPPRPRPRGGHGRAHQRPALPLPVPLPQRSRQRVLHRARGRAPPPLPRRRRLPLRQRRLRPRRGPPPRDAEGVPGSGVRRAPGLAPDLPRPLRLPRRVAEDPRARRQAGAGLRPIRRARPPRRLLRLRERPRRRLGGRERPPQPAGGPREGAADGRQPSCLRHDVRPRGLLTALIYLRGRGAIAHRRGHAPFTPGGMPPSNVMKFLIVASVVVGTLALLNPTKEDFAQFAQTRAQAVVADRARESSGLFGEIGRSVLGTLAREAAGRAVERTNY